MADNRAPVVDTRTCPPGSDAVEVKRSRLATGSLLGAAGQILTVIVGLWATPKLVLGLGDATYSVLAIIISFIGYFAYLELGFGPPYIRQMTGALVGGDHNRAQCLFETAHAIYLFVAAAGSILIFVIGVPYLNHSVRQPELLAEARRCLIITAAMFAGPMMLSGTRGVVMAAQRYDTYAKILLVVQPAVLAAQVAAVRWGGRLFAVLSIQTIATVLVDLSLLIYALRLAPMLRIRARFHLSVWLEVRSFSLYKLVQQVAQQGQLTGDRLLLGAMLPLAEITPYAVAASIAQRVRVVVAALLAPFYAAASEQFAAHGAPGLAGISEAFARRIAVLLALAAAGILFLAHPFLLSWMGSRYADAGAPVLSTLGIAAALSILALIAGQATDAAGNPRPAAEATVLGLAVALGSSLLLIPRMGASGAAFGFLAGAACQFAWSGYALGKVIGRRSTRTLASTCFFKPILMALAALVGMILVPHGARLPSCLPAAIVGGIVGVGTGFALGILRYRDLSLVTMRPR